jgi:N-acyl-D-amino-acid deacylase
LGVNVGSLVGWNVIRSGLVGEDFKNLSDFELKQLLILVKQSMKDGALGVSFGFGYPTGRAISKREIVSLYKEIKKFNPLFSFNLRDEDNGFAMAVKEVLDIVEDQKINTLISSFKVQNEDNFSNFDAALKLIDDNNIRNSNNIYFSIYPYDYTCQSLFNLMPD